MRKLTDNEFSKSFLSRMRNRQVQVNHVDISKQEIQKCWERQIPYFYKDNQRVRKENRFIRANADGSEDVVELTNLERALYSQDIRFKKIRTSRPIGEGILFQQIKK